MTFTVADMRVGPTTYAWSRFGEPEYTDWLDESLSWKQTCALGDWSFLWQHRLRGPDVLQLLADTSVNSYATFRVGQSKHAIHTDAEGSVIHEGIVTRYAEDDYVIHGRGGFWVDFCRSRGDYDVTVSPDDWFVFQVSGPLAVRVLDRLCADNALRETRYMHVCPLRIAGNDVWALRQGMSGEVGFELQGPREHGAAVHAAVMEAGQEFGIRRLGARVTMINHLEACYPTIATDYIPAIFGEDMAEYLDVFRSSMPAYAQPAYIAGSYDGRRISEYYRSPIELGWARTVSLDHEFPGRAALAREKAEPRRVMRTLEWNSEDVTDVVASLFGPGPHYPFMDMPRDQRGFMWADRVTTGDDLAGVATSRGYSYSFRRMLSLATLDVTHADPGTPLTVHWGTPDGPQKAIRATVAPAPYKPDRSRIDLHSA